MDVYSFALNCIMVLSRTRGSVTSWLRSDHYNQAHGGNPLSLHLYGLAMDCTFDSPQDQLRAAIMFTRLGLYAVDTGTHLHVQTLQPLDQEPA